MFEQPQFLECPDGHTWRIETFGTHGGNTNHLVLYRVKTHRYIFGITRRDFIEVGRRGLNVLSESHIKHAANVILAIVREKQDELNFINSFNGKGNLR